MVKTSIIPSFSPEPFPLGSGIVQEEAGLEYEVVVEGEDHDDLRPRRRLDFSLEVSTGGVGWIVAVYAWVRGGEMYDAEALGACVVDVAFFDRFAGTTVYARIALCHY